MKRYFTFLFISCLSVALLQAQVTLTKETHGFATGVAHESQPIEYQAPGEGGTNMVWDFSSVKTTGEVNRSATDFSTDLSTGHIKAFRQDDQVAFWYNISELGNEYLGYEGRNHKMLFTKPLMKTMYPQSFGTYFEGTFEGEYTSNSTSYPISGTYSTEGDATGTITLPSGETFSALRIHTTQLTEINGSGTFIEKYLWYAQDVRLPLFVSIQVYSVNKAGKKTLSTQESYYNPDTRSGSDVTAIDAVSAIAYKVFPNPFEGVIEMTYDLPQETAVTIDLFDTKGSKLTTLVSQTQTGSVAISKDVTRFTQKAGTYLLKIQFGDKTYTEKIVRK